VTPKHDAESATTAAELHTILTEVSNAKVVVLFLTPHVLQRPWVLLECFWACVHHVPIVPVQVKGIAYDHAAARRTLANLHTALEEANPGSKQAITKVLAPLGYTMRDLCVTLHGELPHLITLPYDPHDSSHRMSEMIQDILERIAAHKENKKTPRDTRIQPMVLPRPSDNSTFSEPTTPFKGDASNGKRHADGSYRDDCREERNSVAPTIASPGRAFPSLSRRALEAGVHQKNGSPQAQGSERTTSEGTTSDSDAMESGSVDRVKPKEIFGNVDRLSYSLDNLTVPSKATVRV